MSPPMADYDHYAEPVRDGYDSEYSRHSFPSKFSDTDHGDSHGYPIPGQHYVTSEPKSHTSSKHTRTTSSARRSRKSSSAARDLVKALLIEKLDAENATQAQLTKAYATLRAESQRAAEAERIAIETAEKLKGISSARTQALQDAARAQAELRAYKLQFENAQQQIRQANELVAQSDTERDHAIQAVARMKKAVDKYREGELRRRAIEQGRQEGREEALRDMGMRYSRTRERGPVVEDDDVPRTPSDATMLPIPPPEGVPIMSRRRAESLSQAQTPRTTTPVQPRPLRQSQIMQPQSRTTPQLTRRNTTTPTNDRSQSPWRPVPPPAMMPVRPPHVSNTPPGYAHMDNEIENTLYERSRDAGRSRAGRESPDQIIIRTPVPIHPAQVPLQPQPQVQVRPPRPPSSHDSRPTNISYPTSQRQRQTRHQFVDIPHTTAALASESANRIYSQVSSSSSEGFEPVIPPGLPEDVGYSAYSASREPPVMAPVPPAANYFTSHEPPRPVPPPNPAHNGHRRRQSFSSSSSASQHTDTTSIKPSQVSRLRNFFRRRPDSASSSSSSAVPEIQIEPPSRPESVETMAATTGGPVFRELPAADPVMQRTQHTATPTGRSPSRTGFSYGPAQPQAQTQHFPQSAASMHHNMDYARGDGGYIPPLPGAQTPGATYGQRMADMNFGAPPPPTVGGANVAGLPRSGSAADYFSGQHHIPPAGGATRGERPGGHRRGESDGTITDPNAYHDPETDPDWDDEDDFGRPETPKANVRTGFAYAPSGGSGVARGAGEYGSRPPSRGQGRGAEMGYEYVPPVSAAAMAASRRAEDSRSPASGAGGRHARTRKASTADRSSGHVRSSTSTSRTPLGNTPFVRSSGLYVDED